MSFLWEARNLNFASFVLKLVASFGEGEELGHLDQLGFWQMVQGKDGEGFNSGSDCDWSREWLS